MPLKKSSLHSLGEAFGFFDSFPLHRAIEKGKVEKAEELIKKGADVNELETFSQSSYPPLAYAVNNRRYAGIVLLLENSADFNIVYNAVGEKSTVLQTCVSGGHKGMAKILILSGANIKGLTYFKDEEAMKALVKASTDIFNQLQKLKQKTRTAIAGKQYELAQNLYEERAAMWNQLAIDEPIEEFSKYYRSKASKLNNKRSFCGAAKEFRKGESCSFKYM